MSEEPRLPVTSCRGVEYDLLDALKRNPTTIFAGDDIAAVAADTITRQQAEIERLKQQLANAHGLLTDFERNMDALDGLSLAIHLHFNEARAALNGEGK